MSSYLAIARPYAKAIFELANESDDLLLWEQVLRVLVALAADESFREYAYRPDIADHKVVKLAIDCVTACVSLKDEDVNYLQTFLMMLAEKKRLVIMKSLYELYEKYMARQKKVISVEVLSASTMSDQLQKSMIEALQRRFESEVSVNFSEDKTLIGGAVIRAGTWVMDGSIRQKLLNLKDCLRG
jgi:F-type H+-transporting ATPase subunit delta